MPPAMGRLDVRAGRDDKVKAHFIGSIVYVERGLSTVTTEEALLVIDGQQRLTTSTLLIAALAEHFKTHNVAVSGCFFSKSYATTTC